MNTVTVSEFEKEMVEIEKLQEQVADWINSKNFFVRVFDFGLNKISKIHVEIALRKAELFSKELIED